MKTFKNTAEEIVHLIETHKILMLDTETVPGFSCKCEDSVSLENIISLKEKPQNMPLTVLVGSLEQATELGEFDSLALELTQFWPYATLIVKNKYTKHNNANIGLRMTTIPSLQEALLHIGPIYSTSINKHKEMYAINKEEALAQFPNILFYTSNDIAHKTSQPSTIINLTTDPIQILRSTNTQAIQDICAKYNRKT